MLYIAGFQNLFIEVRVWCNTIYTYTHTLVVNLENRLKREVTGEKKCESLKRMHAILLRDENFTPSLLDSHMNFFTSARIVWMF